MAYFRAYRSVDIFDAYIWDGEVTVATGTTIRIEDGGLRQDYHGRFTYARDYLTGGTLSSTAAYAGGVKQWEASGLAAPAIRVADYLDSYDVDGLVAYLLGGDDRLVGSAYADRLGGFAGDDLLDGGAGDDVLEGGVGHDTLTGGRGADQLIGGEGNDVYIVDDPGDRVIESAGGGYDVVRSARSFTLPGHVEELRLTSTGTTSGYGNAQDNRLLGGSGNDRLYGQGGRDTLAATGGNDLLYGGDGADRLDGGRGNDRLDGGTGNDTLLGSLGRDTLIGGSGDDSLSGGNEADRLYGGIGNDRLDGGYGNDRLEGGAGSDTLRGGGDDDVLVGSSGNDRLDGGAGQDRLYGGIGRDVFVFRAGEGSDTVSGFTSGQDRLDLRSFTFADGDAVRALASPGGGGVLVDLPGSGSVLLEGLARPVDLLDGDLIL